MVKLARSKHVGRGSDQFMLRLPDGMRDFIAGMAERNRRSMNAEIVNALVHQIARSSPGMALPSEIIDEMNDTVAQRIREGEIQRHVREVGQKIELIAKELDHIAAESQAIANKPSQKKKNPPA
jgi:hypothetical protein